MKLQQLRFVVAMVRHNLNVSQTAEALFTSQPGVSRQIRALEEELGVELFERRGKQIVSLTEAGERVVQLATEVLQGVDSIRTTGREFANPNVGELAIATTHTQARYVLPPVIEHFRDRYPHVALRLHQGTPAQIAEMLAGGDADLAISTEGSHLDDCVLLPCYRWNRSLLVPDGHPLQRIHRLDGVTIEALGQYPIVTYTFGGRCGARRDPPGNGPGVATAALSAWRHCAQETGGEDPTRAASWCPLGVSAEVEMNHFSRIANCLEWMAEHQANQPTLDDVAAQMNLSPAHAQRVFKQAVGLSPKQFILALTHERSRQLLAENETVLDAALTTGLSGASRLHDLFVNVEAMTPGEYRNGGARNQTGTRLVADQVFNGNGRRSLSLLLAGTPFQIQVWRALIELPDGARARLCFFVRSLVRLARWHFGTRNRFYRSRTSIRPSSGHTARALVRATRRSPRLHQSIASPVRRER